MALVSSPKVWSGGQAEAKLGPQFRFKAKLLTLFLSVARMLRPRACYETEVEANIWALRLRAKFFLLKAKFHYAILLENQHASWSAICY